MWWLEGFAHHSLYIWESSGLVKHSSSTLFTALSGDGIASAGLLCFLCQFTPDLRIFNLEER